MEIRRAFEPHIEKYCWNVINSNSYLLLNAKNALLIDAVDSSELLPALKDLDKLTIILTHCHFDHICGLNRIREMKPNAVVITTSLCSQHIGNKFRNLSATGNAFMAFYNSKGLDDRTKLEQIDRTEIIDPFVCEAADVVFNGEMQLEWEGHSVVLSQYYGHSNDSLIAIVDGKYMFSGDTILGIPTATRFPGGSTARFWEEDIPRLMELSSVIEKVFPGHGEPGKLSDMIAVNQRPKKYRAQRDTGIT